MSLERQYRWLRMLNNCYISFRVMYWLMNCV